MMDLSVFSANNLQATATLAAPGLLGLHFVEHVSWQRSAVAAGVGIVALAAYNASLLRRDDLPDNPVQFVKSIEKMPLEMRVGIGVLPFLLACHFIGKLSLKDSLIATGIASAGAYAVIKASQFN